MDGKIEQRVCIKFCVKLGKSATATLEMLREAFGEYSLSCLISSFYAVCSMMRSAMTSSFIVVTSQK
jgi:uncharacterized metal-binding protein